MRVRVKLYGTLRRFSLPDTPGFWEGDLPEGASLTDLIAHLGATPSEVAGATIDDVPAPLETPIPAGAEVRLVTPMGGGSTPLTIAQWKRGRHVGNEVQEPAT